MYSSGYCVNCMSYVSTGITTHPRCTRCLSGLNDSSYINTTYNTVVTPTPYLSNSAQPEDVEYLRDLEKASKEIDNELNAPDQKSTNGGSPNVGTSLTGKELIDPELNETDQKLNNVDRKLIHVTMDQGTQTDISWLTDQLQNTRNNTPNNNRDRDMNDRNNNDDHVAKPSLESKIESFTNDHVSNTEGTPNDADPDADPDADANPDAENLRSCIEHFIVVNKLTGEKRPMYVDTRFGNVISDTLLHEKYKRYDNQHAEAVKEVITVMRLDETFFLFIKLMDDTTKEISVTYFDFDNTFTVSDYDPMVIIPAILNDPEVAAYLKTKNHPYYLSTYVPAYNKYPFPYTRKKAEFLPPASNNKWYNDYIERVQTHQMESLVPKKRPPRTITKTPINLSGSDFTVNYEDDYNSDVWDNLRVREPDSEHNSSREDGHNSEPDEVFDVEEPPNISDALATLDSLGILDNYTTDAPSPPRKVTPRVKRGVMHGVMHRVAIPGVTNGVMSGDSKTMDETIVNSFKDAQAKAMGAFEQKKKADVLNLLYLEDLIGNTLGNEPLVSEPLVEIPKLEPRQDNITD